MSVITKDLGVATAYGYAKSKGYTGTEEEFAELMASYADVAQQAEAAAQDAEDAKDEAVTAKTDAQTAKTAAQAAQSAAETASGAASTKASEAAQSAQAASGSATAAQTSATAAAGSAQTAQAAAQTATTKASEASSSASAASTAKTGAETARTGAQTAQTAAETAQANAEAAASSVSASAAQIEQNTEDIAELKNDFTQLEETKADKTDALSAYVVETETGSIASFSDGADDVPVKDLIVAIEPVQDLHGQSSPWPAGGGKNLFDINDTITLPTTISGVTFDVVDSVVVMNGTATAEVGANVFMASLESNTAYTVSVTGLNANTRVLLQGFKSAEFLGTVDVLTSETPSLTFNTSTTYDMVKARPTVVNGATVSNFNLYIQVEKGSSATTWSPYSNICPISGWTGANVTVNGSVISITFPTEAGTVYGGTLDVTTGVLTVDRAYLTNAQLLESSGWTEAGRGIYVASASYELPNNSSSSFVNPKLLATALPTKSQDELYSTTGVLGISQWWGKRFALSFADPTIASVTAFKAKLAENGTDVVYPLATPQTYQLTPQEVSTILGQNNIFADTGNVTVHYRADTKLYIDKALNT